MSESLIQRAQRHERIVAEILGINQATAMAGSLVVDVYGKRVSWAEYVHGGGRVRRERELSADEIKAVLATVADDA